MNRIAWIAAGTIVGTALSLVVNLATSGGAWWLWPLLGVLVLAAIAVEVRRNRRTDGQDLEITASSGGQVEDSHQLEEGTSGEASLRISARGCGIVRRSTQTFRQR